jgi:polycomb protein EED
LAEERQRKIKMPKQNSTHKKKGPPLSDQGSSPSDLPSKLPREIKQIDFRPSGRNQQKHQQPLYCVAWSHDIHVGAEEPDVKYHYAATCGANQVTIYEVEVGNPRGAFEMIQSYKDDDKEELFYACAFGGRSRYRTKKESPEYESSDSSDRSPAAESSSPSQAGRKRPRTDSQTMKLESSAKAKSSLASQGVKAGSKTVGPQLLCVAGVRGVIKVLDPVLQRLVTILRGHGSDIYDLKVSPMNANHLLSASVDESIRLWNLESFACVAIFAGHHGHREAVLSISWHPMGDQFASAGMDKSIRLWKTGEEGVAEALQASQAVTPTGDRKSFHPHGVQFPYFATEKVHINYVDCVQFVGDLILSKSTYNSIVLWLPDIPETAASKVTNSSAYEPPGEVIALRTFDLDHCEIWFVRFAVDDSGRLLAVGNIKGEVHIWDIDACKKKRPTKQLKPMVNSTVRMLAFSPDSKTLLACDDSATVCKWDTRF